MRHSPSKRRRLEIASDSVWGDIIRLMFGQRCGRCGSRYCLDPHHLVKKRNKMLRHVLMNGFCLCRSCHRWAEDHPKEFEAWLKEHWRKRFLWLEENRNIKSCGTIPTYVLKIQLDDLVAIRKRMTGHGTT